MKKKFTQEDIDQFFGNFKELPDYFELEKVHQLMDNPAAKATQPGNNYFKPYKFLIMTSTIVTLVAALLLWPEDPLLNQEKSSNPAPPTTITAEGEREKDEGNLTVIMEEEEAPLSGKEIEKSFSNENPTAIAEVKEKAFHKGNAPLLAEKAKLNSNSLFAKKEISWPADTVIDGSQFLITLTDEELKKLGFMLDETGIYYNNIFEGDTTTFYGWHENGMGGMSFGGNVKDKRNKKFLASSLDFYPITNSDVFFLSHKKRPDFRFTDDTLAPIIIKSNQLKYNEDDIIVWFKINDQFFDALPIRYQHFKEKFQNVIELKKANPGRDIIKYEGPVVLDNMRFIELSEEELIPLGFRLKEEGIYYEIFTNKSSKVNISLEKGGRAGISVITELQNSEPDKIMLSFLSDQFGIQTLKWRVPNDDKDKMKATFLLDKNQLMVPLVIKRSSFPDILQEDQVFWFEPSEALFAALPEAIGNQLRQEYNYLTAPNEEARKYLNTSCTFFEACKSTLQINNLKLMPNPASYTTTISFEGLEEALGSISLVNLSGNLVKELVPNETFKKGANTIQLDLSGIGPGIYLISINTEKGFKTQRLIITR